MKKGYEVEVASIPGCDLCGSQAYADARIPGMGWANVCQAHFAALGCSLGLGKGQKLVAA